MPTIPFQFRSWLFYLFLVLASCKGCDETAEPENKKPEPTTDGRNTFYCEINGVPYYQKFLGGQPSYPTITGSFSNSSGIEGMNFTITYPHGNSPKILGFSGFNIFRKRRIVFPTDSSYFLQFTKAGGCDYFDNYKYNSLSDYLDFSRYDQSDGIFSGTFSIKIWLPDSVSNGFDTVKITNGIFDLKLGY